MTSEIRQVAEDEIPELARVAFGAYPGVGCSLDEWAAGIRRNMLDEPQHAYFGLWRDGALLGGMRCFDFRMRLHTVDVLCGGVGMVAVDLLHKKEQVAKELISFYLNHYHQRGALLAALYPFRPDFYRQMGFGYGLKTAQYRVKPASLPRGHSKAHLAELGPADAVQVLACYQRRAARTHGLFQRGPTWAARLFEDKSARVVGYREGGQIAGYAIFSFRSGRTFVNTEIELRELVYEHTAALAELLTFFHSQLDQIQAIVISTQDEDFHHVLHDPRNGSENMIPILNQEVHTTGLGIMYRILDLAGFFTALAEHNFGGQSCVLRLVVDDGFLQPGPLAVTLAVAIGRASLRPDASPEVELRLGVAEASSLLMGSTNLRGLLRLGLAQISDSAYIDTVHRLFLAEEKPVCMTAF